MAVIYFHGTAGARFSVISQKRKSAGIWIKHNNRFLVVDPGPGALTEAISKGFDLPRIEAIILTHKHIDHSNDVNILIEAMTSGGRQKKGILIAPRDCFGAKGVVLDYYKKKAEKVVISKSNTHTFCCGVKISMPCRLRHSALNYGLVFSIGNTNVGVISDTEYFSRLAGCFSNCDIIIVNVLLEKKITGIKHLSLEDAVRIISCIKPKKAIITHFGIRLLRKNLKTLEKNIKTRLGINVVFAYDGMAVKI